MRIRHMAVKALVPFLLAALLAGPAWPQSPDGRLEDFLAAVRDFLAS